MAFLTFRGGVHPYDGKELSKEKPVREYFPGKEMVYPLSQHIGAPAQPVVKKGRLCSGGTENRRDGRLCFCTYSFFCIRSGKGTQEGTE